MHTLDHPGYAYNKKMELRNITEKHIWVSTEITRAKLKRAFRKLLHLFNLNQLRLQAKENLSVEGIRSFDAQQTDYKIS